MRPKRPKRIRSIHTQLPATLFSLCLESITCNLNILGTLKNEHYNLHENLVLPSDICEAFLQIYQDNGNIINDSLAHLFKDVTKTHFKSVYIHDSNITNAGLENFLRHNLYELKLTNCRYLNHESYAIIFKYSKNLRSLVVGPYVKMTISLPFYNPVNRNEIRVISLGENNLPNLKLLALKGINKSTRADNIPVTFKFNDFLQLKVLDLSYSLNVPCLQYWSQLPNLHTLILFNLPIRHMEENNAVLHICNLKSLVVLDISRIFSPPDLIKKDMFNDEKNILALIVKSLPKLESLDISGTNLAGRGPAESQVQSESLNGKQCSILGLESRVDNPLEYLGLYHTLYNACEWKNIPAKIISGSSNEEQLHNALTSFKHHKPILLSKVLSELTAYMGRYRCTLIDKAVHMVIDAIAANVDDASVQISGISTLYQIMSEFDFTSLDIRVKRRLYSTLETGLSLFNYNDNVSYKLEEIVATLIVKNPEDIPI